MKLFKFAVATLTLLAAQNLFAAGTVCAHNNPVDREVNTVAPKSTKTSEAPVANLPAPKGDGAR